MSTHAYPNPGPASHEIPARLRRSDERLALRGRSSASGCCSSRIRKPVSKRVSSKRILARAPRVFFIRCAASTAPNVYMVQNAEVEAKLFNVKDLTLLWSGSSTTHPTSSMQVRITEFGTVLVEALAEAQVII